MMQQQQANQQQRNNLLLITSNIGSLFGDKSSGIRNYWLEQICNEAEANHPFFVAIHVQESGGKNYKTHSKEMPGLVEELQRRLAHLQFVYARCFLDIQFEVIEEYTALSSLFFIHKSAIEHVSQYNFRQREFVSIGAQQEMYGNKFILSVGLPRSGFVRKEKFAREFWPTFRFSRKGFLHTRWMIGNKIFDLINIHLFHDESNLNFLENPHQYSINRRRAMNYVLGKFEKYNGTTIEGSSHLFIFGDFNFRLHLANLIKKLTLQTNERQIQLCSSKNGAHQTRGNSGHSHSISDSSSNLSSHGDESSEDAGGLIKAARSLSTEPSGASSSETDTRNSGDDFDNNNHMDVDCSLMRKRKNSVIEYYRPIVRDYLSPTDNPAGNFSWVLRIGKKRFEYCDNAWLLNSWSIYREDDNEAVDLPLHELPLEFPPTYPWSEEADCHWQLMNTRAPAWCDRILFNQNACELLTTGTNGGAANNNNSYRSFGMDNCTGDHKPVLLLFPFSLHSSAHNTSGMP